MRKSLVSSIIFFTFASCGYAKKFSVYANSGLSFPTAPSGFTDGYNMGFNFGGGIEYSVLPFSMLCIRGNFDYNKFLLDKEDTGVAIEGGNRSIILISGSARVAPPIPMLPIKPYILGGVGLFQVSTEDVKIGIIKIEGDSESAFSLLFGAGIDFSPIPLIAFFVEGNYVLGFTEDENTEYFPVKLGLKIGI